ncbi:hypothetical protein [Paenibacillus illinoisensis]|uniref:hypothetical protein n=1 Tax=Paenibacillus illinoisensis TaxID=59845 RepID=UPI003016CF23
MNKQEYGALTGVSEITDIIQAFDLTNQEDRTLLYGYTCDRETWHVYLKGLEIHVYVYGGYNSSEGYEVFPTHNNHFVPDKRLYPERCDFEFCKLLKMQGVNLTFTSWSDEVTQRKYYGEVIKAEGDSQ